MYLYKYTISQPHLHKYAHELHDAFLKGKTSFVRQWGNLHVRKVNIFDDDKSGITYFIIDPYAAFEHPATPKKSTESKVIRGFVALTSIRRWKAKEVHLTYVMPQHRRKNYAYRLYREVVNDGVILLSGIMQNPKSRNLWIKLCQARNIVSWAHDILNTKRFAPVQVLDDELMCSLKIYEDIKKMKRRIRRQDVRLVLCKK